MTKPSNLPIDKLIELAKSGMNRKELADYFNVSMKTISVYLSKNGLRLHDLKFNHNSFDYLDKNTTYWLGYLFADGCCYQQDNCKRIEVTSKDFCQLKAWHEFLDSNMKIHPFILDDKQYYKSVHVSPRIFNKLISWGCLERKSLVLKFPNLKHNIVDFIRGYFDGDGSVSLERKKNRVAQLKFGFVGTKHMLDTINYYCPINLNIRRHQCKTVWVAENTGNLQAKNFYTWLYKNWGDYSLPRKRLLFEENF